MKIKTFFFASLLLPVALAACKGSNQPTEDAEESYMPERTEDNRDVLIVLGESHVSDEITMNGHLYRFSIDRTPLDSVVITDEDGYQTQDNAIQLSILRDGAPFFQRTFTRSAFHINVPAEYYQQCVLLGMNFDRETQWGLRFVASIGKGADSEDYKPYAVTVGPDGSINITEHELYDDSDLSRFEDEGV